MKYQENSVSNSFLKAGFLVFEKRYDWKIFLLEMLDVLLLSDIAPLLGQNLFRVRHMCAREHTRTYSESF